MLGGGGASAPSGRMFVCALLVARNKSPTSNIGDSGQDVITMIHEAACLPLYLLDTEMAAGMAPGMMINRQQQLFPSAVQAFSGSGNKLGER